MEGLGNVAESGCEVSKLLVLFGAGDCGRSIARVLKAKQVQFVFVDNDPSKHNKLMLDTQVFSPEFALSLYYRETWVVSIGKTSRHEVIEQLKLMGIEPEMPWKYLDMKLGLPPTNAYDTLKTIVADTKSFLELEDQVEFRKGQDYDAQRPCEDMREIYFPDFIMHRADEHFVDCGAADGDTIAAFMERWLKWESIVAFEPDQKNYNRLIKIGDPEHKGRVTNLRMAVSDFDGDAGFTANGDYSSHLGGGDDRVRTTYLDKMLGSRNVTYIKMDIEGSELQALWGARHILKEHKPVLAICAYHESDHLWQIPLLIHAIQPEYELFLRRYSPGTMDLVWYAVPTERVL